jgi:hypothetical protein
MDKYFVYPPQKLSISHSVGLIARSASSHADLSYGVCRLQSLTALILSMLVGRSIAQTYRHKSNTLDGALTLIGLYLVTGMTFCTI